jgi:hypothetical protein
MSQEKILKTSDISQYRKDYYLNHKDKYEQYRQKEYICGCCDNKHYKSSTVYHKHLKTSKHKANHEAYQETEKTKEMTKIFNEFLKTHFSKNI